MLDSNSDLQIYKSGLRYLLHTIYEILGVIWYHLYNLKNVKNTHPGALKSNTPSSVIFKFFKLYK